MAHGVWPGKREFARIKERGVYIAHCPQSNTNIASGIAPVRQYLDAGADIFTTNTFNANAISMEDYGMQGQVRNINLAAGKLAREVADDFMKEHPDRTIFVAGSVGQLIRLLR